MSYAPVRATAAIATLPLVACMSQPAITVSSAPLVSADSAAIDSVVTPLFALDLAPGMAVAVVRGEEVIFLRGYGYADRETQRAVTPETIFYIASTTKAFTGLAAAILDARGLFELDAPLSRYLPGAQLQAPLSADSVTIRSLLSHTHGIGNEGPIVWRTAFTGEFASNEQLAGMLAEHAPARSGTAYAYGNIGYNIASLAIDRAVGRSWKDVLADEIFRPLGMSSTSGYVSRVPQGLLAMPYVAESVGVRRVTYGKTDSNMHAAGGLVSSAQDMARWLEAQLNDGQVDGRQVLPAAAVAEAQRMQTAADLTQRGMRQVGYSLGWQLLLRGADTLYAHGGGFTGFASYVTFLPKEKLGVAVMTNEGELGSALTDAVTRAIYTQQLGSASGADVPEGFDAQIAQARQSIATDRARRAARSQVLPFPLEAYAGVYENPSLGTIELRAANGKLEAQAGAALSAVEVFNAERNQLRVELTGSGSVVTVEMQDGRAAALTFLGRRFVRR